MWPFTQSASLHVEFLSLYPHLEDAYPIFPAKDHHLPWVKESQARLASKNTVQHIMARNTHKCSGIMDFHHKGWVVPASHDFIIETNGDGESLKSYIPSEHLVRVLDGGKPISSFSPTYYGGLPSSGLPQNTLKSVVKLSLPWIFRITEGWGLLMLPLEYMKEDRFTSATGILNPQIIQQINIVLYWHVLNGVGLVKAGTPLCRLIPVPLDDVWRTTVRQATDQEKNFTQSCNILARSSWSNANRVLKHVYDQVVTKKRR